MSALFIYRNMVQRDNGEVLATFSSHTAAVCAWIRLSKPDYAPLGGWGPGDLEAFEELKKASEK